MFHFLTIKIKNGHESLFLYNKGVAIKSGADIMDLGGVKRSATPPMSAHTKTIPWLNFSIFSIEVQIWIRKHIKSKSIHINLYFNLESQTTRIIDSDVEFLQHNSDSQLFLVDLGFCFRSNWNCRNFFNWIRLWNKISFEFDFEYHKIEKMCLQDDWKCFLDSSAEHLNESWSS